MYKRLPVKKLSGTELFQSTSEQSFSVLDFWRYAFSNLNSNVIRGALAEFLVENALRKTRDIGVRNPWEDYDVLTPTGEKIEVKCSAYLQDWDQNDLSKIVWTGLKAQAIYPSALSSTVGSPPLVDYKADIYILALLHHQDSDSLDILDLKQWSFFVLTREELKSISQNRSSVSLIPLEKTGQTPITYAKLSDYLAELSRE